MKIAVIGAGLSGLTFAASSERKFACGAGSSGARCVEGETSCDEAGTKVS
jgi:hypothetical protein